MTANRDHYVSLDALRLVLFGMILYAHSSLDGTLAGRRTLEAALYQISWSGVQGFFVLSAFIITTLLLRERERAGRIDVAGFYRRRVLKILPPLLVTVALVLGLMQLGWLADPRAWNALAVPGTPAHADTLRGLPTYLAFIGNIPYALGLLPAITPALLIMWTLCVEEQFYLLHPHILRRCADGLATRRGLTILLALIGAVLAARIATYAGLRLAGAGRDVQWRVGYTFSPLQADSLLVGVLVAAVLHGGRRELEAFLGRRRRLLTAAVWLGLPALTLLWAYRAWWSEPVLMSMINLYFGAVVLWLVLHEDRIAASGAGRFMARLGRNGYCLYLVHHLALLVAFGLLVDLAGFADLSPRLRFWLRFALAFGVSLAFAAVLYRLAEAPFRRFRAPRPPAGEPARLLPG